MTGWACAQVGGGVSLDEACVDWCAGDEPLAMHPLCGAAPEQKGCNAYGSGALPLRTSESVVGVCRGDCVAQSGGLLRHRCVWIGGHYRPREGAADPRRRCVWIGVQETSRWRCTRYVALHPNRRGVMPTVRVHCPSEQVKVWLVCAGVAVLHRGEGCLVTQRGAPRGVFNCLCIRRFV